MNFLSLNLLNDIVTGKRDVQGAKAFYAQTAEQFTKYHITSPYTEGFLFPMQYNTADLGVTYLNKVPFWHLIYSYIQESTFSLY